MKVSKNTDIIREDDKDYVNVRSANGLLQQMIASTAEDIYSFGILFGAKADKKTVEDMKGTYWTRVTMSDGKKYAEDVEVAICR